MKSPKSTTYRSGRLDSDRDIGRPRMTQLLGIWGHCGTTRDYPYKPT